MQRKIFILTAVAVMAGWASAVQAVNSTVAVTPAPTPVATAEAKVDSSKASDVSKIAEVDHKSPLAAGALAFSIPGMFVHGIGHMYAGSWIKGLGLLAIEGSGIGVVSYQISTGIDDIKKISDTNNNGIPVDLSSAYGRIGMILVGTAAFLFTWWDDVVGAPIAAQEYNKRADQEASRAELNLLPVNGGAQLVYTAKF